MKAIFKNRSFTHNYNKLSLFQLTKFRFSIIGIDIGGTNTCMSILEPGGPRVIENSEGLRTTPSFITLSPEEDGSEGIVVAVNSKKQAYQMIDSTFYGMRHFFTNDKSSIFNLIQKKRFPFKIEADSSLERISASDVTFSFNNKKLNAIDSSAAFMKYCKEQADGILGKSIKKIVLAVPHSLNNENSKNDLSLLCKNVGLSIVDFIEEPKAVVVAYELVNKKRLVVFNLGGTEMNLFYLKKSDSAEEVNEEEDANKEISEVAAREIKNFTVEHQVSNNFLGGNDIDDILTEYLCEEFEKKNRADARKEPYAIQRIKEAAEKAKIELSLSNQVEINLPFLMSDAKGPKHLQLSLGRSKFERLIDDFTTKVKKTCEEFKSKIDNPEQIDDILLSGGLSRMPVIQDIIKSVFGKEPNKAINPEESAAIGAGIIADSYKSTTDDKVEFTSLPLSLGIETLGGQFSRILEKGKILPAQSSFKIGTVYDNQPLITLKLYLGEREICEENRLVGEISMPVPLAKRGESIVNVSVKVEDNGYLSVRLIEQLSKKALVYSVDLANGLTPEIVEDVLSISDKFKEVDDFKLSTIQLKREVDGFINSVSNEIKKIQTTLTDVDSNYSKINDKISTAFTIIEDLEELISTKEDNSEDVISKYKSLREIIEELVLEQELKKEI